MLAALVLAALFAPLSGHAQCVLEGHARVADVRPTGTSLALDLDEHARVTLRGRRAEVHGISPIELDGRAAVGDVELMLASAQSLRRVITAAAGTPLRVLHAGTVVRARLDVGASRVFVDLPCEALSLDADAEPGDHGAEARDVLAGPVQPRGRVLHVYASDGAASAAVVLRDHDRHDGVELPVLEVIERRRRLHVRAELDLGVTLDGWVERAEVTSSFSSSGGWPESAVSGGCGWGYWAESYRGPATVIAGTELVDGRGVAFARVLVDVPATVAVALASRTVHVGPVGSPEPPTPTEVRTVHVDAMAGFTAFACSGLGFEVPPDAIRLPP